MICPTKLLKERYDFEPTEKWADHLRLSSVRFNSGGSGSFISSDGLVLTNHHVASDTLHKLSTPERNLIDDGYLAKKLDEELKAPDLELNQLVSIEDVTERVNKAVDSDASAEDAVKQRRAVIATIEKESLEKTGLRSDVVTLVWRRQVSPLSLQEVHRRSIGLGPRNGSRVLRR